ncbi:hypothetical protein F2P79_023751 [Pimephales promelas]|nr:hypothetical protein F2P79_023751 [Pimephales promelas]
MNDNVCLLIADWLECMLVYDINVSRLCGWPVVVVSKVGRNSVTFGTPSDLPLNNEPVAFLPLQTPLCGEL